MCTCCKYCANQFMFLLDPQFRYYVDTTYLNVPRPGMEVVSYMKDGSIDNWDLFEKVMDYAYAKVNFLLVPVLFN